MCYNIQKALICAYQEHLGGLAMMEEFLKEYDRLAKEFLGMAKKEYVCFGVNIFKN